MGLGRLWIVWIVASVSCSDIVPEPPKAPRWDEATVLKQSTNSPPPINVGKPQNPIATTSTPALEFSKTFRSTKKEGSVTIRWQKADQADGYMVFMNRKERPIILPKDGEDYGAGVHQGDEMICNVDSPDTTECKISRKRDMTGNETSDLAGRYFFSIYSFRKIQDQDKKISKIYSQEPLFIEGFTCEGLYNKSGAWVHIPIVRDVQAQYNMLDFCVQTFPATVRSDGIPASLDDGLGVEASVMPTTGKTFLEAWDSCNKLNSTRMNGYHLMKNEEWMTITSNAMQMRENWSGGAVGSGMLVKGHHKGAPANVCPHPNDAESREEWMGAANCQGLTQSPEFQLRRTIVLSNGKKLWDMVGNLWQWVDYPASAPPWATTSWGEVNQDTTGQFVPKNVPPWPGNASWNNANNGTGLLRGGSGKLMRGGGYLDTAVVGLWAADFFYGPNIPLEDERKNSVGFRCVWTP